MPRDYKNAAAVSGRKTGAAGDSFLSFFSGLSIGLLVAFAIFLYQYLTPAMKAPEGEALPVAAKPEPRAALPKKTVPEPTFDFYQILPSREVNLSEWVEDAPRAAATPAPQDQGLFVLQVGSFKTFEAADQTKAELALIGIDADIQRVVINGQDIRHRVRIGPYREPAELEKARRSLLANNLDFMLLRLEDEQTATGGGPPAP
jgi:cell division protein FtsN